MRIRLIMFTAATLSAAATLAITGCSSASGSSNGPGSGSSSSAKSQPERIVSLSPSATEDLYAIGAGKQVVAVDETSNYPASAPRTSMSGIDPNIEAIARYNPTLVIAQENANGLVAGMKKLGIKVLVEPSATSVASAYSQIDQIGQATGHSAQAVSLMKNMRSQIAADVKKAGSTRKDLSYFWEVSARPYYSATSKTLFGQIAGMFGLKNIADAADKASDGGFPEVSDEYIVAKKPQIIFLADNQASDGGQSPAIVAKRPGWSAIPAVKNKEIIPLNDDIASRWGPRLPQLVAQIERAVESASGK